MSRNRTSIKTLREGIFKNIYLGIKIVTFCVLEHSDSQPLGETGQMANNHILNQRICPQLCF